MKLIILIISVLVNLNGIKASYSANCEIEGVSYYDWGSGSWDYWDSRIKVKDDHEGVIKTLTTTDIQELLEVKSSYLDASYENNVLTLTTNEMFKNFEDEYDGNSKISITLKFNCTDGKSDTLTIRLEVEDVNNHDPVLDKEVYEYNFGTTIPEDFDLTKFLSITASDYDFSNSKMYFSIEVNENLRVGYNGNKNSEIYSSTLKALKEIKAPFKQEFTLVAADGGTPPRNTSARVVINVGLNGNNTDENILHPPVFSKHLYFANYTSYNDIEMEETISIKYGAQSDTFLKQSGYEEYLKIELDNKSTGLLKVTKINPLSKNILESGNLIMIEIEAENPGLIHMPGRTALIIRLPQIKNHNGDNNLDDCNTAYIFNSFYENSVLPLVIYLCIIFTIVVANVAVMAWYFQKRTLNNRVEHPRYVVNDEFK